MKEKILALEGFGDNFVESVTAALEAIRDLIEDDDDMTTVEELISEIIN